MISISHSKSVSIARQDLHDIPITERDNVSSNWKGVQHGELADTIIEQINSLRWSVKSEQWFVSPNRTDLIGGIDIASIPKIADLNLPESKGACFSLGVRHSNAGRYAVSFAVGARVFACDNGVFQGEFVLRRKHTQSLDIVAQINEGLARYAIEVPKVQQMISQLQCLYLSDAQAAQAILEANRQDLVNWQHLQAVSQAWDVPPHEEFIPRNAWSLYNAFTEVAKTLSPPRQLKLVSGLKPMFDGLFGVN